MMIPKNRIELFHENYDDINQLHCSPYIYFLSLITMEKMYIKTLKRNIQSQTVFFRECLESDDDV
jgi:hypothetical protein